MVPQNRSRKTPGEAYSSCLGMLWDGIQLFVCLAAVLALVIGAIVKGDGILGSLLLLAIVLMGALGVFFLYFRDKVSGECYFHDESFADESTDLDDRNTSN